MTLAGVVPDIDGLGVIVEILTRHSRHPLEWFSTYHHATGHACSPATPNASLLVARQRWKIAPLTFLSFHLHLLEDLLGARGPDSYPWPIPYLMPFSQAGTLSWIGQWALNAWPNFLITGALLIATFYLAWRRGYSPLEMVSLKADAAFVGALRNGFSLPENKSA